ncbi:D-alanyl-D-alanine carboxypeptidase/D-alanyl-D-alanine-endopeptidase [Uruburuella testudinis]|uniref:D-alanyl-D-alanine carboxypeptidase/D-alanyl-D-alanine-endopeptidase n=1 Tax=Uruburuella testudinis TaxID=1282863 RepID=A0ABY4DS18_9NEIS|nr:D-alanyl-D-alanine carboxypeptidase/D-alanyl-D-alanine-endopeptidase [Uruburuella testudinis]UOO81829.1 D-alanyl-D-alanine carboxypeptidase/D-alanyl-D-alanine-endopeptidase [Uruburuella testudinis]
MIFLPYTTMNTIKPRPSEMLRTLLITALLALSAHAAALDFGRIRTDEVAVYAQNLASGEVIAAHRADAAVNPASTMKLVTTFAALRALGDDYRWLTEWKSDAAVRNGVLEGDIYWVGSGNPVLDQNDLLDMQSQLRTQGIRNISGQLVLDRSVWQSTGSADDFDDDAGETFATAPDPQMLAYKVVWAKPERNALGNPEISLNPPLPGIPLQNRSTITAGTTACRSLKPYLQARYQNGTLWFDGQIPASCLGQEIFINMLDPTAFAGKSFINHWRAAGGGIADGWRTGRAPRHATTVAANQSKPLAAVLADMNKHSNNIIARSLFLTLGSTAGNPSTARRAEAEVRRQLVQAGIDDEALVLENGSGLSRRERLTARMLGQILANAWHSPFQTAFTDSLPVAGHDGTLKNRFKHIGRPLHLKTGTLKNVRALAGYWLPQTATQPPLALVVIINSDRSPDYLPDLDKLLTDLLQAAGVYGATAHLSARPSETH